MEYKDWGLIPYNIAYEQQKELFESALQQKAAHQPVSNQFILCEHPPVITLGKNGLHSNLLVSEAQLKEKHVEWYPVNRGGDATYHGPGQIVGYPILDLEFFHLGLKEYIHRIEEMIIRTLSEYGLKGERIEKAAGVWLDANYPERTRKIAAIGVHSSRYVTMHGFALNVNTDLSYFQLINPCGFTNKGVTSLQRELGYEINLGEIKNLLINHFERLFLAE